MTNIPCMIIILLLITYILFNYINIKEGLLENNKDTEDVKAAEELPVPDWVSPNDVAAWRAREVVLAKQARERRKMELALEAKAALEDKKNNEKLMAEREAAWKKDSDRKKLEDKNKKIVAAREVALKKAVTDIKKLNQNNVNNSLYKNKLPGKFNIIFNVNGKDMCNGFMKEDSVKHNNIYSRHLMRIGKRFIDDESKNLNMRPPEITDEEYIRIGKILTNYYNKKVYSWSNKMLDAKKELEKILKNHKQDIALGVNKENSQSLDEANKGLLSNDGDNRLGGSNYMFKSGKNNNELEYYNIDLSY